MITVSFQKIIILERYYNLETMSGETMGIHVTLEKDRFRFLSSRTSADDRATRRLLPPRSPWPSATQDPAGSRTIKRAHTFVHTHARSHTSRRGRSHESRPSRFTFPLRRQPSRSFSLSLSLSLPRAVCGVLFTSDERAGPLRCPTPHPEGAHLRSSPPRSPIHHAVVCRPCVLPHTTYVGRHATSAHAHPAAAAAAATAVAAVESASKPVALLRPRARTRPRTASRVAAARGRR